MLEYRKLSEAELATNLVQLPEWSVEGGMLTRLFTFDTYKAGLVFAVAVGYEADRLNHHPDIMIGYQNVRISTSTHDTGGLTSYDLELAARIDRLAP